MSDLENSTLTLEEMILGVNKDELPRISIEDAEIVRRQYLSRIKEAVLTIRPDGITFNNACITRMSEVYFIQIFIDRPNSRLIIRGCEENDKDGQKWCNEKEGARKSRKISGRPFCSKLYSLMGWSKGYYYKIIGSPALRLEKEDELLYVFELKEAECFELSVKAREKAGVSQDMLNNEEMERLGAEEAKLFRQELDKGNQPPIPKRDRYPEGWSGTFGEKGSEHIDKVTIPRLDILESADVKGD